MRGKSKLVKQCADVRDGQDRAEAPAAEELRQRGLSLAGQISICTVCDRAVSEPGFGGLVWSVKW